MNLNFNGDLLKEKFGYLSGPATALENPTLQAQAQNYRRFLSNQMYLIDKNRITEKIPNLENLHASRKIDGEFCLLFFDGETAITCNPGGTIRAGLPCLEEAANLLVKEKIKNGVFACELFLKKKGRERVHDVIRVARNPKTKKDLASLSLYIFDIVELNGEKVTGDSAATVKRIAELFEAGVFVKPVESVEVDSNLKIVRLFEDWVEDQGSEGIVVRHDSVGWFKIKPEHNIDAVVVGFSDSINERQGMLHDMLVGLLRSDGNIQLLGKVGNGFSDDDRREYFSRLAKMEVKSDYVEVSSNYLAYTWVEPTLIIELKVLDVISKKSRGDNINKMVLEWDAKNETYSGIRKMPFVSVFAPRFERVRDDKSFSPDDIGTHQVSDLVEIDQIDKELAEIELPPSEILKREVYVKEQGEKVMVRKFFLWKTNKEKTGEYPEFITYYTDFSSQRKDPLQTKIQPAHDLESAERDFAELIENGVKSGWNKHG